MSKKSLTGRDLVEFYKEKFGLGSQSAIGKSLDLTQGRISHIQGMKIPTKSVFKSFLEGAYNIGLAEGIARANTNLLDAFGVMSGASNQTEIANLIGKTRALISQWKSGDAPISEAAATLLLKKTKNLSIKSLYEMLLVEPGKPGGKWYFFNNKDNTERKQVLAKLRNRRGIYCYFDSRGHLTYVGKADRTFLDVEVEARLSQKVAEKKISYWKNLKKPEEPIVQGHFVKFISIYEVEPREMIAPLEALLIRCTSNMQFNRRLENLDK